MNWFINRYHITIYIYHPCVVQIEDLQLSMSRMEKEHGRREDVLRQEISDLHQVTLVIIRHVTRVLVNYMTEHLSTTPGETEQ